MKNWFEWIYWKNKLNIGVVQMKRRKNRDYNEMKGDISKIFMIFNCIEEFFMFIHFLNTINWCLDIFVGRKIVLSKMEEGGLRVE